MDQSLQAFFRRQDESDDSLFYTVPRKVVHIDDYAIAALTDLYRELLQDGDTILDLMSSWRSHLPPELRPARTVGLGMNAEEMAENPQLDEWLLHDLNHEPALPFNDGIFDAALCAVSVQYMTRPLETFAEVRRLLKPGGIFAVSFSNRCFPTKAVSGWLYGGDQQHLGVVQSYFEASAGWRDIHTEDRTPQRERGLQDPLFAAWAYKVSQHQAPATAD